MTHGLSFNAPEKLASAPAEMPAQRWNTANINAAERWIPSIGGGVLVAYGLGRRDGWGLAFALLGGGMIYQGVSRHNFVFQLLGRNTAPLATPPDASSLSGHLFHVERTVTVNRSPEESYQRWHNFEQLPDAIAALKKVQIQSPLRSRWIATIAGQKLTTTWNAEITSDEPGEHIAWQTLPGSFFAHHGMVSFTPATDGRGTEVKVTFDYVLPGGSMGALVAKLIGRAPEQQIREGLRHFKALLEAGEIPTTQGQPRG
jgi:uncharacterized membrane protein